MANSISNLAVINPNARIGNDVTIGPFCVIHGDVEIGDGCELHNNVTIYDGARIGKHCKLFPGSVISAVPQDLKFENEVTIAQIGDHTTIRECVTINRGTKALGKTVVGSNNLLMAYVHVAHDCIVGNHCILANLVTLAGHITIDDYAIIGGISAVHQFVHIGSHVMISGGSLVRKDVPPYTMSAHEPLSYIGINAVGLRRRGYTNDDITSIHNIYRIVFEEKHTSKKAIELINTNLPESKFRSEIVKFISDSQRGIMKGYAGEDND
ncbi:MAG: acyl-ACP--UDP-N-acetylglucosamine O-acyltransferase [Bacteroidetes bacterium]|nr:acyl-ACP--UDP-N-acetylglucosamine O-acyltransferase [Bacteroidota bacterium]